jgi:predicted phage terminase large subunit-like protein
LSTRLNNKATGLVINIQQRLHIEDVTGWLLENQGDYYQLIKIPSEASRPEEVSPPELFKYYQDGLFWNKTGRFSRADLEQEKKLLGSRGYAQMHLQTPTSEDDGVYKRSWFTTIPETEFIQHFVNAKQRVTFNFFLDSAYTANKKNDASAICVAAYLNGKVYLREVRQVRKEFPDLVKWLKEFIPKYYSSNSRVYIEAKASGLSLIQQLRSEGGFNVLPLDTGRDSKLTRAIQQSAYVESGNVYVIKGEWNDDFLEQVSTFVDGKSGHDDMVDAFVYALRQRKAGQTFFQFIN